ncbi:MAG: hypothetical protein A3G18_05160 [Rhodospirillales bacterium RIFCSPLOWO2_12_FULL_58_28]|nr:MAG: hypothetical protein A3H92_05255 [Rhodospirillales bacterium RIFCSPLOWO2_02_FULL_58_16]OHC78297.1 MAG: hypothetical protein A3G18_05160 [Rhodospirillales bacterium RIFCSPLOWO2_12_FULL_58_28]
MTDKRAHLESLARLAVENSDEGRQQLLREVTDLFMEAPQFLNEKEISYFGEIMGRIVVDVETKVRQHLAERISTVSNAPGDLIRSLANDKIEVALPVLVNSDALKDDELIQIVKKQSQEHLKAISMRTSVNEKVTDALVVRGNDSVLETLAGNDGARFSRDGIETIVERAKSNDSLNKTLVARNDTPDDMAKEIFWRVSWAMREQILNAGGNMDKAEVDALMKETEQWFIAQGSDKNPDPAESFIIRKEKLNQLDNGFLLQLLRQDKVPEFVAGLGRLAKIDIGTARQTAFDPTGEKLAIVCKAVEMNYDMFGETLILTNFDGARSNEDNEALLRIYDGLPLHVAQRAMRFLRTRKSMQKQIAAKPAP